MGFSGPMGVLDLAAAGLERFHAQAAGLALDIEAFGPDQAVWLGVMGALGYPRNKRAFRMLATRVPWSMVAACGSSQELESLLLQAAGLGTRPAGTHSTPTRISSCRAAPRNGCGRGGGRQLTGGTHRGRYRSLRRYGLTRAVSRRHVLALWPAPGPTTRFPGCSDRLS